MEPYDSRRLANLCGQLDEHLHQIELSLHVKINSRGNFFEISGQDQSIQIASDLLSLLYHETEKGDFITPDAVHLTLREFTMQESSSMQKSKTQPSKNSLHLVDTDEPSIIKAKHVSVKPRGKNQQEYVNSILHHDINFGIGPAGTGKTYLAVACAVAALDQGQVNRIILVRPAVEAGEKLGFLPGDLAEKVNPYLRPLYDALYEMLGFEWVGKLIERHVIEVAPLAYMRGRTLNDAFVILDESQNTTKEQMKMFLTRLGFNSKTVITGDCTQVDLPRGVDSGLAHAIEVLKDIKGIGFSRFTSQDVVRHHLVKEIVEAYEQHTAELEASTFTARHYPKSTAQKKAVDGISMT